MSGDGAGFDQAAGRAISRQPRGGACLHWLALVQISDKVIRLHEALDTTRWTVRKAGPVKCSSCRLILI